MSLINELIKIGLSDKEAKVYLANLELGQSAVQAIAKKAGVNRATTYVILNSLIKKGLASTYEQDKKTYYVASSPESLESIFELQKKEIEEKQKYFLKLLADLKLINNKEKNKPVIRFFEGKEGILRSMEEFLSGYKDSKKDVVRLVYPKDRINEIISQLEYQKFRNTRLIRNIKSKALYTFKGGVLASTKDGDRVKISEKDFPITCDLEIYKDNIIITSLGNKLSSVFIKDKEIANTFKSIFDLAWEAAKARTEKEKKK